MKVLAIAGALITTIACSSPTTSSPAPSSPTPIACVTAPTAVIFDGLNSRPAGSAAPPAYTESGFTIRLSGGGWSVEPNAYAFRTPTGTQTPGLRLEAALSFAASTGSRTAIMQITNGGCPFTFASIVLYSSVTDISYEFDGFKNNTSVYSASATISNLFGAFQTVVNPRAADPVDALTLVLTNRPANAVDAGGLPLVIAHLVFNQ